MAVCQGSLVILHIGPRGAAVLTSGEEDGVELEAAAVLQPTGQLAEEAAVQVEGDFQGLSAALHLVAHWSVCAAHAHTRSHTHTERETGSKLAKCKIKL